jgi:CRISPR/Cas system Type II protein with McrA/HNH and RuvC-like nuclease domain
MKEKILELRNQGKTYNQIIEILGCSKSTVSYYCGNNQKNKTKERTRILREKNPLIQKIDNFKSRDRKNNPIEKNESRENRYVDESIRKFQIRDYGSKNKFNVKKTKTFNTKDVVNKFGENTICYLSGVPINLSDSKCCLDHIIPVSRGGDNTLDNLGITHKIVNQMKSDLTPEELINWCVKILTFNGYNVNK